MRELLKEARDKLKEIYNILMDEYRDALQKNSQSDTFVTIPIKHTILSVEIENLLPRIDSALSAPDESALEKVRKIRDAVIQEPCEGVQQIGFMLTDEAAAALIEPSVPRKMLWEIHNDDRLEHPAFDDSNEVMDAIAAKHGVKVRK